MIKKLTSTLLLAALAFACVAPLSGQDAEKKKQDSQKKQKAPPLAGAGTGGNTPHYTTSAAIGPNRRDGSMVTITYGRPYVKHPRTGEARQVWGKLVAWDKPDRLGADEATLLIAQHSLVFGQTTIPAGAYTLYIVPSEKGTSRLAFSKNIGKWGVPVDDASDVARVDLQKETLEKAVDQLTITVENVPGGGMNGVIKIQWENTQFTAPFAVKK